MNNGMKPSDNRKIIKNNKNKYLRNLLLLPIKIQKSERKTREEETILWETFIPFN